MQVLRGTSTGLTGTGSQIWSQYSPGIAENPEADDRFGSSLAVGDLGGSVAADLAIGVPEEDGDDGRLGVVHVLLGSATGLSATGSSLWSQNSTGIGDDPETGDGFGASLAIGNVGGSAFGDLIVGVPGEDVGAAGNAGIIQTIPGSAGGPTGTGSQTFSQATAGIADNPEDDDEFGYALAVGDFGGDSFLDLAVGAPGESGIEPALRRRPSDPGERLRPHRDRQPALVAELGRRRGQRRGERPIRRRARRRQLRQHEPLGPRHRRAGGELRGCDLGGHRACPAGQRRFPHGHGLEDVQPEHRRRGRRCGGFRRHGARAGPLEP